MDEGSSSNASVLANALLEIHELKYLKEGENLQDLAYVYNNFNYSTPNLFLSLFCRVKQDLLMSHLHKQTDRINEAVKHTQVYEMV